MPALCEGLEVSRSGFFAWRNRCHEAKPIDVALERAYHAHRGKAGASSLTPELQAKGFKYCAKAFRKIIKANGLIQSMSRKANCWDNAVSESFFATLKKQSVHGYKLKTRDAMRQHIFEYIAIYYNRVRRHSANNWVSPVEFERLHNLPSDVTAVH